MIGAGGPAGCLISFSVLGGDLVGDMMLTCLLLDFSATDATFRESVAFLGDIFLFDDPGAEPGLDEGLVGVDRES